MANVTSLKAYTADKTCTLHAGDHPFIKHNSVIAYGDAKEWWINGDAGYDERLAQNMVYPDAPLDVAVLRRIQEGALKKHSFFKIKWKARVEACLV